MDKFQVSILEYLGRLETGILVLISITYDSKYYESTYFYTDEQLVLTASEGLEEALGHKIIDDDGYVDLIKDLIKKVVPYNEMWIRIDDIDFSRWMIDEIENEKDEE